MKNVLICLFVGILVLVGGNLFANVMSEKYTLVEAEVSSVKMNSTNYGCRVYYFFYTEEGVRYEGSYYLEEDEYILFPPKTGDIVKVTVLRETGLPSENETVFKEVPLRIGCSVIGGIFILGGIANIFYKRD